MLLNLVSNAIKYSREGGAVALQAGSADNQPPWTTVLDSGAGLTAEQIARLFKPFERLGQEAGAVEGTGLGRALSARLVQAVGGRIDVSSEVGRGSLFTLSWQDAGNATGGGPPTTARC